MPKLLLLCEYATLLGGERSMLATLDGVRDAGFKPAVACPLQGPLAAELRQRSVPVVAWHAHDENGARFPLPLLRERLTSLLQEAQPNLLHANSLSMARVSGPVARDLQLASVGHLRDIVGVSQQAITDINCHRRLIAVSHATHRFHVEQGIEPRRLVVAHNGVDLKEFQNRPSSGYLHRELGLPAGARLIVTIGQLGLRKGTDVALAAFRHITRELSDVHWLVVGTRTSEKPESIAFEAQLRTDAANVSGRVHLLGQRDDVAAILNECHLLVHAAHQEPLGRVLLEAAACGLPVVATDVGGTREIFPDESAGGVLVAAGDAAALAAAVVALLNDDTRRGELGAGADRRAGAEFDARQATHRLCRIYADSLTNTAPD